MNIWKTKIYIFFCKTKTLVKKKKKTLHELWYYSSNKKYAHEYLRHVIIGNLKEKIMTEITCYMLLQLSLVDP